MFHVAAIQMASGPNVDANLNEAARLIKLAADSGASLCALPENFALMGISEEDKIAIREPEGDGPIQRFLARQAARHEIWLVGGTIPLCAKSDSKVRAACLLFNDQGELAARYDKIHLFDVNLSEKPEDQYTESRTIESGDRITVADTPFGRLGLSVCYDLRFPELFRCMLDQGLDYIAAPAAFTAATGKAHWETLVRARAMENLCYVIAPNQGGYHVNGRETYGDSMIVDPWGVILARLPHNAGIICANLDREHLLSVRKNFPAIAHRKIQSCQVSRSGANQEQS
ncbi:MAG: carbon-nitrogen hydrolase family protein [Gammaproteobacteria bacterium]|nr:carbon-nitrogen hydrolase family protein [Gammaproteobacteria bacterium]